MSKKKLVSVDLRKFLDELGVELKDGQRVTKDLSGDIAQGLSKQLQEGLKAQQQIKSAQGRNYDAELKKMNVTEPKDVATVDEFRETAPGFALVKASQTCSMKTVFGMGFNVTEGQEYCLSSSMYRMINQQSALFYPSERTFADTYNPYHGEDLTDKTLFVWREGGIGDLLFIRPILVHLKKKYPTAKVIFATRDQYGEMMSLWDDAIDELKTIPFASDETIDKADYHLTFMGVIEHIKEAEQEDVHNLFARYAGLNPGDIEWAVPMPTTSKNVWFETAPTKYAVVQTNSTSQIRTPLIRSIIAAINTITAKGMRCVLADRKQYARRIDDIISMCEHPEMLINYAHFAGTIQDVVRLIDKASLVVAPDSSMVHIAAMQRVPCVGVYGPFLSKCRTSVYPLCATIEPKPSDCCVAGGKGCFLHNNRKCEFFQKCWKNLDDANLSKMIEGFLDA